MSMFGAITQFFDRAVEDFAQQTPVNQIAIGVTLASVSLLPVTGYIWSFLRVRDKTARIHRLEKETRSLASERDKARKEAEGERTFAGLWMPERWLERADHERRDGNEESAIRILSNGIDNVTEGIASVARQLADHALSLMEEQPPEQALNTASRYAQLAALLKPDDEEIRLIIDEINDVSAAIGTAVTELDLKASSLPADPTLAGPLIRAISRRTHDLIQNGHFRLAIRLARRGILASRRAKLFNTPVGDQIRFFEAEAMSFAGHTRAALDKIEELLREQERELGPQHSDVLRTRYLEAKLYAESGNISAALHKVTELLPLQKRVVGIEDPDTMATAWLEALILSQNGKPETALKKLLNS